MLDIFKYKYPREQLNPEFLLLSESAIMSPAKNILNSILSKYEDKDGNFVEQFQTTGFKARIWEIFLNEFVSENNFEILNHQNRPDFHLKKDGAEIFIEASTSDVKAGDKYTKEFIDKSMKALDLDIQNELIDYFVIRMGSVLFSKLNKRYWELDWVKDKPLILAITPNHNHIANFLPDSKIIEYLYGLRYTPEIFEGEIVRSTISKVEKHQHEEKEIPSNFFSLENTENISAVIFTNNCDLHKFNRMGQESGLTEEEIIMVRSGISYDQRQGSTGHKFSYNVLRDQKTENWSESVSVFHNPNALQKVDKSLFKGVRQIWVNEKGSLDGFMPDFFVYTSLTGALILK